MKWALWILAGLGAALLVLAGSMAGRSLLLTSSGASAEGEIVDIRVIPGGSGRTVHAPIVQFRAGPRVVRSQLNASTDPIYLKGDRVHLYYSPAEPQRFVVADFEQMWQRPLVVTTISMLLFAAAWLVHKAIHGISEPVIFSLAVRGIGGLLVGAAIVMSTSQWLDLRRGIHTVGTVVNGKGEPWRLFSSGNNPPVTAEISFTTTTGRKVIVLDPAIDARFKVHNAPVHLYYDSERPQRARVATFVALWFRPILLGFLGLAALGAGFGVHLLFRT